MKLSSVFLNMQLAYEMFVFWLVMNWRNALSGMALILLLLVGGFGYQSYSKSCQMRAHKSYIDVMRVVNSEVATKKEAKTTDFFESQAEKDAAVVAASELFLKEHGSSGLAASVLGFSARALNGLGKKEEARTKMHLAEKASSSKDLKKVYAFSGALMDLDSGEESVKAQGLACLKELSEDESSSMCDAALYYLGLVHWNEKNYSEARLAWGHLIVLADNKKTAAGTDVRSPWVNEARDKLSLIDYK